MTSPPGLVAARWAQAIVAGIASAGIRHLVISPGSRSTPLVLAAHTSALHRHVVIDERAAAFFALGLARELDEPVALLCTSGSAGGHYLPAIMEASHAGVPLVAITADRPFELMDTGANQTTDQARLFGTFARRFVDLGDPRDGAVLAVAARVQAAVIDGRGPDPGPVHINARFAKPLEPETPIDRAVLEPVARAEVPRLAVSADAIARARSMIAESRRGLIVAGPGATPMRSARTAVAALSRATGFPLLADAASQLRFGCPTSVQGDGLGWQLPAIVAHEPDLLIRLGAAPIVPLPLRCRELIITERAWANPSVADGLIVRGSTAEIADALARDCAPVASSWRALLATLNEAAWAAVDRVIDGPELSEPSAVRAVVEATPLAALLHLGNSLPVRLVDRYCRARNAALDVSTQRGLSGIDGVVAQTAGAAAANRAVVAIVGDVTFAHDIGSVALAARARSPIAIVVIDNQGGRIFESLPIATHAEGAACFEELYVTAPDLDLATLVPGFGAHYSAPAALADLRTEVARAAERPGCTVIHVRVPASSAREIRARVEAELRIPS